MSRALIVRQAGPSMTVQDGGRPGWMAHGLSAGGSADRRALIEGAVLLGQGLDCAALEMAGAGGAFEVAGDLAIALTGAPMRVSLDGKPLAWNASHVAAAGQILTIGGAAQGVFGYLHVGGGFAAPLFLGSRSTHLTAGIGAPVATGDRLEIGLDAGPETGPEIDSATIGRSLPPDDRFGGGTVRVLPSVQTARFSRATLERFTATEFLRAARGNRQGVALEFDGQPFALDGGQLTILSEPMLAGDIQMTGSGQPFVLLAECQTTGGYPRIATVLPDDLPIIAQAGPGAKVRFEFVDHATACAAHRSDDRYRADLQGRLTRLIRDPRDIPDLLSFQLIGGVTTGRD